MKKFKELDINEQHREKGRFKPTIPRIVPNVAGATTRNTSDSAEVKLKEAATGDTSTFDTPVGNQFRQGDSPAARSMLEKPQKEPMKKYKEVKEDSDIDLEKDAPSVEAIAKKHGVSVDEIEKQLKIGMSVETEHGKNKGSEREIAMDHLNEKPDYYIKLKKYVEETEVNEMLKPKMSALDKWRASATEREKMHNQIAAKQTKDGSGMTSAIDRLSKHLNKEEVEQLEEGRPSQRHPLEGHEYHRKTNAELEYIAKDAHKAAEAMKSHNTTAENKYRDQANDSATVRHFRKTSGSPDWYKKKYNLKEETEMENTIEEGAVPSTEKTVALRHKSSGKEIRVTQNSIRAYRSLGYHPIREETEQFEEGQNKQVEGGDPCWKNYQMVGKKMKNGKEVPNCVPVKEAKDDDVGEMIKDKLKIIINRAQEMHDEIGDAEDMPEWVKSKVTLAQDYISTACDYSCGKEQLGEEMKKHPFVAVHAKKGKHETHGSTSYEAAQNAAKHWKMKNTAGIDVYRADKTHVAEEVEQIDELSKSTLGSYVKKASVDRVRQTDKMHAGTDGQNAFDRDDRRSKGIPKAIDRLTKEEVEHLNEDETLKAIAKKHDMKYHPGTYGANMSHATKGYVNINRYGEWGHYKQGRFDRGHGLATAHGDSSQHFKDLDKHLATLKEGKFNQMDVDRQDREAAMEKDGWKKTPATVTDKSGAKHSPMSRARDLARLALNKKAKSLSPVREEKEESRKAGIVKNVVKSAKKKKSDSAETEKFESEPVLSSEIQKQ